MTEKTIHSPGADQALLVACRAGDQQAWARLLDKYERLVYSIPLNYGLAPEDAADIAQLAFTYLLQSLATLPEDSNVGGWLATVARRHTWRLLNRRKRQAPVTELDHESTSELIPDRKNAIERWEIIEWLNAGLNQIGDRCRELLVALYFETAEPSYAEIAQRLGMAEGSVGPTRARCLQRLKEMLGGRV